MFSFKIIAKDKKTFARAGVLKTPHGDIETPAFIAVAIRDRLGIDARSPKIGDNIVLE